jgi:hypothetical protein
MVGNQPNRAPVDMHLASGHALMSLLREGGQWDDDDDLRANITQQDHQANDLPKTWSVASKQSDDKWTEDRPPLPSMVGCPGEAMR